MLVTPWKHVLEKKKKVHRLISALKHTQAREGWRDVLEIEKVNPYLSRIHPLIHPTIRFLLTSG